MFSEPLIMNLQHRHIPLIFALFFLMGSYALHAQVEFPGEPLGINRHLKAASVIYTLPPPDPLEIDALTDPGHDRISKALPFALKRYVNLSPEIHGSWSQEEGMRVWRVHLISPEAYSLGAVFGSYRLEPGVKLFVYDPEMLRTKGAFTSGNNKSSGRLSIGHVPGQELIIELQVPLDLAHFGELELESLSHAFLDLEHQSAPAACPGDFDCSQACEIDVNCSEGDDWWMVKPSVVRLYIEKTSGFDYCTGVLVNNTAYDGTPYILTAQHCIGTPLQAEQTLFHFNYQSDACFGEDGALNMSIYESELMSVGDSLDFSLVKLSLEPPASYGVRYAGWERSGTPASPSTTIHHPMGDVKKITFDDHLPEIPEKQSDVPAGDLEDYPYFSYWWIKRWETGTTEGGSSGGPLFNAAGRVIGTLSGGLARCGDSIGYNTDTDRIIYNNVFNRDDYFTQFGMSWDYEKEKDKELARWLDPLDSGVETLGGYNPSSLDPVKAPAEKRFQVYPNPASRFFSIVSNMHAASSATFVIRNISGALLYQGELDHEGRAIVDTDTFPPGIYLISVNEQGYLEHHKLIVNGR